MEKVYFEVDATAWHRMTGERLWATPFGDGIFRLENSPLYAYGISNQDLVVAQRDSEGVLRFERPHLQGGHSTYRVVLRNAKAKGDFEQYWEPIEALGCTYESSRDPENVFAIDVPPKVDIYIVYALLEKGEREGVWEFEEGHCGHL